MSSTDVTVPAPPAVGVGTGTDVDLAALLAAVATLDTDASDAVLIDRITGLERLKASCAAAQARLTATFAESVTADAAARHHRLDAARRSIAGQVGLARRESPHTGRRHVGVAAALTRDMPHTLAALSCGLLSERRARIVVEQWACLTPELRLQADAMLAAELPGLGDRSAETRAAAVAYRLDPETVMAKVRGAVKDRHVGLRPAPDAMSRLSALLPVGMGVAVYAALCKAADAATAAPGGDGRGRGQLMADALVSAVTGKRIFGCDDYGVPHYAAAAGEAKSQDTAAQNTATLETASADEAAAQDAATPDTLAGSDLAATGTDLADRPAGTDRPAATPAGDASAANNAAFAATTTAAGAVAATTPVAVRGCTGGCGLGINLVMTDRTLLDGDDEPAHLTGFGPIPAALARALVIGNADTGTRTFIRRLYTDRVTGHLTTMDSRRRLFPPAAQRFLLARDQTCRTPWCDAPIRDYDHLTPHADGGSTTVGNGQGLCKACNLTKQAPGWSTRSTGSKIKLTVPTGHSYSSVAPPPPRSRAWHSYSSIEHHLANLLARPA